MSRVIRCRKENIAKNRMMKREMIKSIVSNLSSLLDADGLEYIPLMQLQTMKLNSEQYIKWLRIKNTESIEPIAI